MKCECCINILNVVGDISDGNVYDIWRYWWVGEIDCLIVIREWIVEGSVVGSVGGKEEGL